MGIYNFQKRFVPYIESGAKTHTIRSIRSHPDKPGNTIHCYTGLRQKGARLLGRFECVKVQEIRIQRLATALLIRRRIDRYVVSIDNNFLVNDEKEALARRDGFKDFAEMLLFWDGRLPFVGHVIHWKR